MIALQRTFQINIGVYLAYKLEAQRRFLFSLKKRKEHEGTQLTEWRKMRQATKGSFLGWNLPGKFFLRETNRGAILKGVRWAIIVIPHIIYKRK